MELEGSVCSKECDLLRTWTSHHHVWLQSNCLLNIVPVHVPVVCFQVQHWSYGDQLLSRCTKRQFQLSMKSRAQSFPGGCDSRQSRAQSLLTKPGTVFSATSGSVWPTRTVDVHTGPKVVSSGNLTTRMDCPFPSVISTLLAIVYD